MRNEKIILAVNPKRQTNNDDENNNNTSSFLGYDVPEPVVQRSYGKLEITFWGEIQNEQEEILKVGYGEKS